ncbi:hypothetical protein EB796_016593 [Bugula neritina]|uniref:Uncharacterized protein n=1 Tax=Bugula neritina TaxID=10212 RepID=A0A7J7JHL4_BUGNE|nr:hypothetical protein EB796_016593 [Bugula neritina]
MGNSCCASRSNRVADIGIVTAVAVGTSLPSLQESTHQVDFEQQCYDGRSTLQLQTPVHKCDFGQQCYEGQSRPSSVKQPKEKCCTGS